MHDMMIALLIVLGVNLIVVVIVAASVLGRKRYLKPTARRVRRSDPGVFR